MPRKKASHAALLPLIHDFAARLAAAIETNAVAKARAALTQAFGGPAPAAARKTSRPARAAAPAAPAAKKAAKPASAAQQKARKLQGQYMGSMRTLSKSDVTKVKAERERNGIEAAIKMANKLKAA